MTEALQLWKNIAGKGDGAPEDQKASSHGRHIVFIFVHVSCYVWLFTMILQLFVPYV